jgi:hypothetical protein
MKENRYVRSAFLPGGGTRTTRISTLLGMTGIYVGILGIIVAVANPTYVWSGIFVWAIGLLFFATAFLEAKVVER